MMTTENIQELKERLIALGFNKSVVDEVSQHRNNPLPYFSIVTSSYKGDEHLKYSLVFEKDAADYTWLKEYNLQFTNIPVPEKYSYLNDKLEAANDMAKDYYAGNENPWDRHFMITVMKELTELYQHDPEGASLLMFKYWPKDTYKEYISNDSYYRAKYVTEMNFSTGTEYALTAKEAYEQVKQLAALSLPYDILIKPEHTQAVAEAIRFAMERDFSWFVFAEKGSSLQEQDMMFFESREEADDFKLERLITDEERFTVLPLEAAFNEIEQHVFIGLDRDEPLHAIHLIYTDLIEKQQELDFNTRIQLMTETMQQDWKDMDPQYLHYFLGDLKAMYNDSEKGKTAVLQLVNEQWPDLLYVQKFLLPNKQNEFIMNEKVFDVLKEKLKNHGFSDALYPDLEAQLKKGATEFSLPYKTEINKKEFEATLHFKKSDKTENVFFNTYDARVQTEKDAKVAQTFYINDGRGVTVKEAYNLLNGRAVFKELVNKDDQKYKAWIQLDFTAKDKHQNFERKLYNQNYGYDIKEALSYFPVKEMLNAETAKDLIRSLEKGNVQMVTLQTADKDVKIFMEANPKYKTLNLYSGKMQAIGRDQKQELMQKPDGQQLEAGQSKNQKQDIKKNDKVDLGDDLDSSKKKSRKNRISM